MKSVMRYVSQMSKTLWDGQPLVSGIGCQPETAFDEFLSTKLLHHKDGGVMFYHMVQSFPKGANIDPRAAHEAAHRLAGYFDGCEVLVCTHVDREHIHSHCIINSVNFETGRKVHMADEQIQELRVHNDQVCEELGLPKFQRDEHRQSRGMSNAEYYTASKGESWKFELMRVIDDCMRCAGSREEFLILLRSEGYDATWTDSRKNITYTTPKGMKCRDDRLHETKYTKEVMEHEFRIRAALAHGGIEAEERSAEYDTAELSQQGGVAGAAPSAGRAGAAHSGPHSPSAGGFQPEGTVPHPGADGGAGAGCGGSTAAAATGWEEERDFCFSAQSGNGDVGHSMAGFDFAGDYGWYGALAGNLVRLGRSLERGQDADPLMDSTTMRHRSDRKTLRKEQEKKIALGHKEDDHEEEQTWQQTM